MCNALTRSEAWENQGMNLLGKLAVSTENAPAAIGPYSQAIEIGEMIYTSGQVGLDPRTGQMVDGGIREQTVRVLENLKAVLAAAGSGLQHVVKTTVFLKDMNDFAAMNEIYATYFRNHFPARSAFGATGLALNARVEIECIAVMN